MTYTYNRPGERLSIPDARRMSTYWSAPQNEDVVRWAFPFSREAKKRSMYTEEQIVRILQEAERGQMTQAGFCRKHGVSVNSRSRVS